MEINHAAADTLPVHNSIYGSESQDVDKLLIDPENNQESNEYIIAASGTNMYNSQTIPAEADNLISYESMFP